MRFKIVHVTEYTFDKAVFLEPHYLLFQPKKTPHLQLESHVLELSAPPVGISKQQDVEGNLVDFCWFEGMHQNLRIRSETMVNSIPHNPFNFLIYPTTFNTLPFSYPDKLKIALQKYLLHEPIGDELLRYGKKHLTSENGNTLSFLTTFTSGIHDDFTVASREEGAPYGPDKTFDLKNGSCRDLVWMQIHVLRTLGIVSRFVSGYYYVEAENPKYELHAWTEVFVPGAGWIGFDPSNGVVTGHTHITVATSHHYENTMPVSGSLRGDAIATLMSTLTIEILE